MYGQMSIKFDHPLITTFKISHLFTTSTQSTRNLNTFFSPKPRLIRVSILVFTAKKSAIVLDYAGQKKKKLKVRLGSPRWLHYSRF
jgi:hypothetical protein